MMSYIKEGDNHSFGTHISYNKINLGKWKGKYITVEEFIPGEFEKHINNNGKLCFTESTIVSNKAEAFVHYTYEKSKSKLMVVDIQGIDQIFVDPEIASHDTFHGDEVLFCGGNLSTEAISNFKAEHTCNIYCDMAGLTTF